ncbi:MAG: hypothetical protein WAV31_04935 [Candidatus Moraniibacteriota bacterium]
MLEIPFSKLKPDAQKYICVTPYAVFTTLNPDDETVENIKERQGKFLLLPEPIKDKLLSSEKIQEIGKKYGLTYIQLATIARAIRGYYFGEVKFEQFPLIFSKEINISTDIAQEISQIILNRIIRDDSQEKAYQAQTEKLSLEDALEKYPEIAEQLITSDQIKLATTPNLVRPSIKNWLSDYTFNIGVSNRDSIVRGNYLFKNANARQLSSQDREKLALILKSFEEKTLLTINNKIYQIIFPPVLEKQMERPRATRPLATPNTIYNTNLEAAQVSKNDSATFQSDSDRLSAWRKDLPQKEKLESTPTEPTLSRIHFSSPQTFSTEKNILSSARNINQNLPTTQKQTNTNITTPRQILKNVINLKEK